MTTETITPIVEDVKVCWYKGRDWKSDVLASYLKTYGIQKPGKADIKLSAEDIEKIVKDAIERKARHLSNR